MEISPEIMFDLSQKKMDCAKDYKKAQEDYAKNKVEYIRLLGKCIMANPKMGIEKLKSLAMEDNNFKTAYLGYEYNKALSKGYEAELDAINTRIISIQSYMKYCSTEDTYGK